MKIQCPHCTHSYDIDDAKIPESGAKVKCTRCEAIFDVTPGGSGEKIYVRTDPHNWFEAGSMEEIREWIRENRLLRKHEISNDQESWKRLDEVEQFKVIFDQIDPQKTINQVHQKTVETAQEPVQPVTRPPVEEESVGTKVELTSQKSDNPFMMRGDTPQIDSMKKLDYADYEDSVIESMEMRIPGKRRKTGLWVALIVIIVGVAFVMLKPELTKKIINKITQSGEQGDDRYSRGVKLLRKYDLKPMDESIKIFQAIQKEKKDHLYALASEVIAHFMIDQYLEGELEINQILIKMVKNREDLKLSKTTEQLEKRSKTINQKRKNLRDEFKRLKKRVDGFSGKQLQIARGALAIVKGDQTDLKRVIDEAEKQNRRGVLLLKSYLIEEGVKPEDKLVKLARKYHNYAPLQYRRMVRLMKQNQFSSAVGMMEVMLAINPENSYIANLLKLVEPIATLKIEEAQTDSNAGKEVAEKQPEEKKTGETVTVKDSGKEEKQPEKNAQPEKKEVQKPEQKEVKKVAKKVEKSPAPELSFDQLMQQADRAFDRERKGSAYKLYKQAAKLQRSAKASAQMGWILFDWGKNQSAVSLFKRAIQIDSNYVDAYLGLGEVYMADENSGEAKRYLMILIRKSPNSQEGRIAKNYLKKLK